MFGDRVVSPLYLKGSNGRVNVTVRRELSLYRMVTRSIPRTEARSMEGCSREPRAVTLSVQRQLPRVNGLRTDHGPCAGFWLWALTEDVLVAIISALSLQSVLIIPISEQWWLQRSAKHDCYSHHHTIWVPSNEPTAIT